MPSTRSVRTVISFQITSLLIYLTLTTVNHPTTELIHGILRGGWECASYCNIFEYLIRSIQSVSIGGRALAGWPNSRSKVYLPRCVFKNGLNSTQVDNLIHALFKDSVPGMRVGCILWPLAECLFATLLLYLQSFQEKYPKHAALVELFSTGIQLTLSYYLQSKRLTIYTA